MPRVNNKKSVRSRGRGNVKSVRRDKGKGRARGSRRGGVEGGKGLGVRKVKEASKLRYAKLLKQGRNIVEQLKGVDMQVWDEKMNQMRDRSHLTVFYVIGKVYEELGYDLREVKRHDTIDAYCEHVLKELELTDIDCVSMWAYANQIFDIENSLGRTLDFSMEYRLFGDSVDLLLHDINENTRIARKEKFKDLRVLCEPFFRGEYQSLAPTFFERSLYMDRKYLEVGASENLSQMIKLEDIEEPEEGTRRITAITLRVFLHIVDKLQLFRNDHNRKGDYYSVYLLNPEMMADTLREGFARIDREAGPSEESVAYLDRFAKDLRNEVSCVYNLMLRGHKDAGRGVHWLVSSFMERYIVEMFVDSDLSDILILYYIAQKYFQNEWPQFGRYQHVMLESAIRMYGTVHEKLCIGSWMFDSEEEYQAELRAYDLRNAQSEGGGAKQLGAKAGKWSKEAMVERARRAQEELAESRLREAQKKARGEEQERAAEARKVRMRRNDVAALVAEAQAAASEVFSTAGVVGRTRGEYVQLAMEEDLVQAGVAESRFESECVALSKSGQFLVVPDAGEAEAIYGKLEEAGKDVFDAVMKANGRVTQVEVLELGEAIAMILEEAGYGEVGRRLVENLGKHDEHVAHQRNKARVELGGEYLGNWRKAFFGAGMYWEGLDVGSRMLGDALERLRKLRRAGEIKREREANFGLGGSGV